VVLNTTELIVWLLIRKVVGGTIGVAGVGDLLQPDKQHTNTSINTNWLRINFMLIVYLRLYKLYAICKTLLLKKSAQTKINNSVCAPE
jgi:hypothetical protein